MERMAAMAGHPAAAIEQSLLRSSLRSHRTRVFAAFGAGVVSGGSEDIRSWFGETVQCGDQLGRRKCVEKCRAGVAPTMPHSGRLENSVPQRDYYTVGDFMTLKSELFCANPSTTVDEALEMLVQNRITGLPVVDDDSRLVGVVSDYDLLALDSISGKRPSDNSLFPEAGRTWKAFKEIQHLLTKTQGITVGDVMTPSPLVVREDMNLEDAARILLDTKYRRLPVVDDSGKLVGLITRGNVVRAALQVKRDAEKKASP